MASRLGLVRQVGRALARPLCALQQPRWPLVQLTAVRYSTVRPRLADAPTASPSPSPSSGSEDTTHFGFRQVPTGEKSKLVGEVFTNVADKYDLMNDLMSAGVHRVWKEVFVRTLDPCPGIDLLDVAGGTGDIAFRVVETLRTASPAPALDWQNTRRSSVVVCDINQSMLNVGEQRAKARGYLDKEHHLAKGPALQFIQGDAQKLPFANQSFDAYTIAFGLRNVTHIDVALAEAYRVLRKGGRFMCLEFSHVALPGLQQLYDMYSFNVIPQLGEWVAGDRNSYQYLVESIRNFPPQEELCDLMRAAGFRAVTYTNLTAGIVAIHSGFKL